MALVALSARGELLLPRRHLALREFGLGVLFAPHTARPFWGTFSARMGTAPTEPEVGLAGYPPLQLNCLRSQGRRKERPPQVGTHEM